MQTSLWAGYASQCYRLFSFFCVWAQPSLVSSSGYPMLMFLSGNHSETNGTYKKLMCSSSFTATLWSSSCFVPRQVPFTNNKKQHLFSSLPTLPSEMRCLVRRVIKLQQSIPQIELDYSTARQGGNVEKGVLLWDGLSDCSGHGNLQFCLGDQSPLLPKLVASSYCPVAWQHCSLTATATTTSFSLFTEKKNTTQQQHQTSKWQSEVRLSLFQKVASKAAPAPFCFLRLRRQATSLALSQLLGCRPGSSWQPRHTRPMGPAAQPAPGTQPETHGQGAGGSAGCLSSAPTGWAWQTSCICWLLHQRLSYYN